MPDEPVKPDEPGPGSDDFDPRKHFWDGKEWWTADRMRWWDGARWQRWDAPHPSGLEPPEAATRSQTRVRANPVHVRDFWLGFTGWLVVNGVLVFVVAAQPTGTSLGAWLVVANVLALVAMAFLRRTHLVLGMLTAFGTAFAVVVLAGVFFAAGDFAAVGSGGMGGAVVVWLLGAVLIPVGVFFTLRAIHRSLR